MNVDYHDVTTEGHLLVSTITLFRSVTIIICAIKMKPLFRRFTIRTQTVNPESNFQELSDAITNLGATLATTLCQAWSQNKH